MIYVGAGRGEEKKQYVIDFLNSKGFTLNTAEIENLIEAAVLELKLTQKRKQAFSLLPLYAQQIRSDILRCRNIPRDFHFIRKPWRRSAD